MVENNIDHFLYKSKYSTNIKRLFCALVIQIALLSNQTPTVFPNWGQSLYYVLLLSRYVGTILLFLASTRSSRLSKVEVDRFKKLLIPVFIIFIIVDVVASFTSPVPRTYGIRYWTRALSGYVDKLLSFVLVISIWKCCGKQSLQCLTVSMLVNQGIIFLSVLFYHGLNGVIGSLANAFLFKEQYANYFEVHELTFCIGFLVIYYMFFSSERKKHKGLVVLLLLLFILGEKRIGFAGIVAAALFSLFIRKKGLSKKTISAIGICGVGLCFLFLAVIYNERFIQLLTDHGINDMGRGLIYGYFTRRTSFKPSFLGLGVAATSKMIENMDRTEVLYMQAVRGVHSSILSAYINYGFAGYLCWSTYNLVYLPRKFYDYYGRKTATLFIALLLYAYITYLTDNTEGYFFFQTTLLLIPISEYLVEKYGKYISLHKE